MYKLYILKCKNGSLYTGIAKNLTARLETHKQGLGSKYVRAHLPFTLVYTEEYKDRSVATKREMEIKKLTRQQKLKLIQSSQKSIKSKVHKVESRKSIFRTL